MPSAVAEAEAAAMDNAVDVWRLNASSRLQGARSPELFSTNFPQRPPVAAGGIYVAPRPHEGRAVPEATMKQWIKSHRVGEVSSKYGYNPEQFDKDLKARKARSDALWSDFLEWMKLHGITPDEARGLFRRMFEEYLK